MPRTFFASSCSVALLLLCACGGSELDVQSGDDPAPIEDVDDALLAGNDDLGESAAAIANGKPQVVYVNFDGPIISNCDGCSQAPTNRSFVIGAMWKTSKVNFAPYTDSAGKAVILQKLRSFYSPYKVTFTTTRPASPYTMLVISPTYMAHHGVAPLDCGDGNRNDIAFIARTGDKGFYPTPAKIAQAAAHELGHSFGLAHVKGTDQIMQWASSGKSFGKSAYDTAHPSGKCFSGSIQDAPALLKANIGLK